MESISNPLFETEEDQDFVYCEEGSPPTRSFQSPSSSYNGHKYFPIKTTSPQRLHTSPDFFKQIHHQSNKGNNEIIEQSLYEFSSKDEEISRLKLELEKYKQNAEYNQKIISNFSIFFEELQYVLQGLFEEITNPGIILPEDKKAVGIINHTIRRITSFASENNLSLEPKVNLKEGTFFESDRNSSTKIETVKKILTYSDVMNAKPFNTNFTISQNLSLKFENIPLQKSEVKESNYGSNEKEFVFPVENASKHFDSEGFEKENESTQRKYYSFGTSNVLDFAKTHDETVFPTARLGRSRFTEIENESKEFQEKVNSLETDLQQANEIISELQEEKKASDNIVNQLRIQKEELIHKLKIFETKTTHETDDPLGNELFVRNSKDQSDELGKFLEFSDSNKPTKEKLKLENYSDTLSNYLSSFNLSKPKDGSFLKNAKNALSYRLPSEFDNISGNCQENLKNTPDIEKNIIKLYENKILDVIEKLEEMKGVYHLLFFASETITKHEDEKLSASWKAFKLEFERRKETLLQKMKNINFEQETNRKELARFLEQQEEYKRSGIASFIYIEDQNKVQPNNQLTVENQELNKLIEALVKENTSLKSQLQLQHSVDEDRKTILQSQISEDQKSGKNKRLLKKKHSSVSSNSYNLADKIDNKIQIEVKNLLMDQTDLFYMLNAQATSLETLLLKDVK